MRLPQQRPKPEPKHKRKRRPYDPIKAAAYRRNKGRSKRHNSKKDFDAEDVFARGERKKILAAEGVRERFRRTLIPNNFHNTESAQSIEDRHMLGKRVSASLHCENIEHWGAWIDPCIFGMPTWAKDKRWSGPLYPGSVRPDPSR